MNSFPALAANLCELTLGGRAEINSSCADSSAQSSKFLSRAQMDLSQLSTEEWSEYLCDLHNQMGPSTELEMIQTNPQPAPSQAGGPIAVVPSGTFTTLKMAQLSELAVRITQENSRDAERLGALPGNDYFVHPPDQHNQREREELEIFTHFLEGDEGYYSRETALQKEFLIPKTTYPWKTEIWPLEPSIDISFQGRCLVKTTIVKEKIVVVKFATAILPVFPGGLEMMLMDFKRQRVGTNIDEAAKIISESKNIDEAGKNIILHALPHNEAVFPPLLQDLGLKIIQLANQTHLKMIHELLGFVFPDYVVRRGWSREYIGKLYRKAIQRRFSTSYVMIYAKKDDGANGRPLASIGMDVAPYGAVRYFDRKKQRYQLSFGSMSSMYRGRQYSGGGLPGSFLRPSAWSSAIPALGIEEDERLPRPLALLAKIPPLKLDSKIESLLRSYLPTQLDPDLSYGVEFFEGRLLEPTKFKIVPHDELRGIANAEILAELGNIFQDYNSPEINSKGQIAYTYNPLHEGSRLYRKFGYLLNDRVKPMMVSGQLWPVLSMDPARVLELQPYSKVSNETMAQSMLDFLGAAIDRPLSP